MFPKKIFSRLFITNLSIILCLILFFLWLYNISFTSFYYSEKEQELESRAILFTNLISNYSDINSDSLSQLCKKLGQETLTRYTIINGDGRVIADSHKHYTLMDNHLTRPEVFDAKNGLTGTSIRYSNTINKEMLYLSVLKNINNQDIIIRTSVPIESLSRNISTLTNEIIFALFIIMIFLIPIILLLSRNIASPLEKMAKNAKRFSFGDFGHRVKPSATIEIESLAESLNEMADQLDERINIMTIQKNENDAILSSMGEGLVATNQLNKIIKINGVFRDLFDIKGRAIGIDLRTIIKDQNFLLFYSNLTSINNKNKYNTTIDDINGKTILCSGSLLKDDQGNVIGNVIVLNDITRLRSLERVRKEFVANVSHELKTPLTALKGYVETLKDVDNEKDKQYFLKILDRHTSRMNNIINDLLELSKLEESNQENIKLSRVNISDLINEAVQESNYAANKKNIQINIKCSDKIYFKINERLILESITNLIHNGIHYSEKNTVIDIIVSKKRNNLIISIKDRGIGIHRKEIDKIFQRFYRIDKSRSKKSGGTGLGLAIVKHIINLHNGNIEVKSKLSKGSEFIIELPE